MTLDLDEVNLTGIWRRTREQLEATDLTRSAVAAEAGLKASLCLLAVLGREDLVEEVLARVKVACLKPDLDRFLTHALFSEMTTERWFNEHVRERETAVDYEADSGRVPGSA